MTLPTDEDRAFWLAVRRGLLTIVSAIERRYRLTPRDERRAETNTETARR